MKYLLLAMTFLIQPVTGAEINDANTLGIIELLSDKTEFDKTFSPRFDCLIPTDWPDCLTPVTFQNKKSKDITEDHTGRLKDEFEAAGLEWGAPVFVRIFKHPGITGSQVVNKSLTKQMSDKWEEGFTEVWVKDPSGSFKLFKKYPICALPGKPGPKWLEGDETTPEGFYKIGPGQMNPNSIYHLSFNVGYPNTYDIACHANGAQGAGSQIMMHGNCKSAGCMAMTDPVIEEIYTIMDVSMKSNTTVGSDGKAKPYSVPFHSFPFPMTEANLKALDPKDLTALAKYITGASPDELDLAKFWHNLKEGYDYFEKNKVVPDVTTEGSGTETVYKIGPTQNQTTKRVCN